MKMKICHITHGRVNPDGENGITRTVYSLNKYLNANGVESAIYSFHDNQKEVEDFNRDEFTTVKLFPRAKFFKSEAFSEMILSDDFDFDVVHFHLMWMVDKNTILSALKKKNIPYIITVHGAYAPNLIDTVKKQISMKTLEWNYITGAKALHALCSEEKAYLRNLKLKMPIYVIPNGMGKSEIEKIEKSTNLDNPFKRDFINIVWVGRIREDKNVLGIVKSLLYMSDELKNKIRIHIIGNGIESYIEKVKNMIVKNNLEKYVVLHGPKYKEEKYQYILNADIYIQPSFSEGISFSILDAMACAKPMILSRQTNMTYYYNKNFYLMVEPYPEDIAYAIEQLASDEKMRQELANNAKKLIETTFNWNSLINQYITIYQKVREK
jgi:glycosyltransferase involved in cell wall biosynthesis